MPFQMPQIQDNIGNALANIGQIRQQRTQNALAEREMAQRDMQLRRQQQEFDAQQANAQRAQLVETTKNVLGALARVPAAQRAAAFQQIGSELPEQMRQHIMQNPDALNDQNIALALNRFGTLTPDQIFADTRRDAEAKAKPEVLVTYGQDGKPIRRAFNPYGPELAQGVLDAPDAEAVMTDRRTREEGAAGRAVTMRGQNLADARARDSQRLAQEGLLAPKPGEDENGPGFFSFDRRSGRMVRVGGVNPAGTRAKQDERDARAMSVANQISVVDMAINHPGRETATGASGRFDPRNYVPGTEATDFQVVLDQINGAAFLQAFETLRGGGQITEVEGTKATNAIARLNRAQSDAEFLKALKELRGIMGKGYARLTGRPYSPAQAGGDPEIDALVNQYLNQ